MPYDEKTIRAWRYVKDTIWILSGGGYNGYGYGNGFGYGNNFGYGNYGYGNGYGYNFPRPMYYYFG